MKKIIFLIVLVVLAGGAWYVNKSATSDNIGRGDFEKAFQIMQNLQSRAVPAALTASELDLLEQVYQDAVSRKPKITTFRDADKEDLRKKLVAAGLTGTGTNDAQTKIINRSLGRVDEFNNTTDGIDILINTNLASATQTVKSDIRGLAVSVNELTNDIRLTTLYIDWYGSKRNNICQTTDATNDIFVAGSITFIYRPTVTAVIDKCITNNTQVQQYKCVGLEYIASSPAHTQTDNCTYGCVSGACLKGNLSAITVHTSATATTEETDIDMNEVFYLRSTANKVSTANLNVEVSSPSLTNTKCELTTRTLSVASSGTALNFGPVRCTTAGSHIFTFTLKDGTTTVGTPVTKTLSVGTVSVDGFEIVAPMTAVVGAPISITVKTIGTNNLPITNYTPNFFVIISGDDGAEFPGAPQKMNGASEKIISGIRFSQAGTVKITIRGEDGKKAETTITVTNP